MIFPRRPSPTDDTLRLAIEALRDTNARLCTVMERQTAVEESRVALDRERFEAELAERERARVEMAERLKTVQGEDLPDVVREQIQHFAGSDAVLRSQLTQFARTRMARGIKDDQIAREIRQGDRSPTT